MKAHPISPNSHRSNICPLQLLLLRSNLTFSYRTIILLPPSPVLLLTRDALLSSTTTTSIQNRIPTSARARDGFARAYYRIWRRHVGLDNFLVWVEPPIAITIDLLA